MRILWFTNIPVNLTSNNSAFIGGWLHSLAAELAEQKRVELAISFFSRSEELEFSEAGVTYFQLKSKEDFTHRIAARLLMWDDSRSKIVQLLQIVDRFKPDLIHIHGSESIFGALVNKTTVPIVLSIQGNLTVYSLFYFRGIEKKITLMYSRLQEHLLFKSLVFLFREFRLKARRESDFLKNYNYIIGRTEWDRRIHKLLAPRAKYFHNDEILRDAFYDNSWSPPGNQTLTIYTTCGDNIYKGLETIIESSILLSKIKSLKFNWKIGGLDENSVTVRLLRRKYKNRFPANILLLGMLEPLKIIEAMKTSHIYVMTSHIENSPNTLCEAMMMGMPIISTFVGGVPSLIENHKNGILVQDGDPYSLAGAVIEMKKDYGLAVLMGHRARIDAIKRHAKSKIVNDLINIYSEICISGNL